MLPTLDDLKFLGKYLATDDNEKRTRKLRVDVKYISNKDKKRLIQYDDDFYLMKGYHMITDYEALL